jgi:EAL domain-containing protein (putative c-di-GMP-specific phosphodiesterase class I)
MYRGPLQPPGDRLLLVGTDPAWRETVSRTAERLGMEVDTLPDVAAAIGWMLQPGPLYSHVLAVGPLSSKQVDALAGMLDEVTLQPTRLVLLGGGGAGGNLLSHVAEPSLERLVAVLSCREPEVATGLPPISAAELSAAMHTGGLRMRFQPIISAKDLRPIGLESLARIHHRTRGILHPRDFISLSVACGRERAMTGIIAARTFLDVGTSLHCSGLFVTLNVPVPILLSERSLARGLELCAVAGVPPSRLVIEALESDTQPDLGKLRAAIQSWRAAGFRVAMDDAGPSLPHWRALMDLDFDTVKLDGVLASDPAHHDLLTRIVEEAKSRGAFVVAEGIETEADLDRVRRLGVDAVQGYLFSRPLPALAVPIWLDQQIEQRRVRAA